MDRLHHPLEDRIEDPAGLLGVAVGEELHRTLKICKEDGHLLALTLQSGLGGEDLVGEMLRRVGRRRRERCTDWAADYARAERLAAFLAEFVSGRVGGAATVADSCEFCPALRAELSV